MDSSLSSQQHRRGIMLDVLRRNDVHSQGDLVNLMVAEGVSIDQATLSRDLRSMEVVKGPSGYRAPETMDVDKAARKRLSGLLKDHLVSLSPAGLILILKITSGYASLVASEIDQAGLPGLLGSIAGRDTIFLASDSEVALKRMQLELAKLCSRMDLKP